MFVNIAYDTICSQKLDCVALHTNSPVQKIELSEATTDAKSSTYMAATTRCANMTFKKLCVALPILLGNNTGC